VVNKAGDAQAADTSTNDKIVAGKTTLFIRQHSIVVMFGNPRGR
jgi:hypothetical protein